MASPTSLRSPQRSDASSPRPKFDADLLKTYMKKLLSSTLQTASWPEAKERDSVKAWVREIGERVKERMFEIQPRGLYVVSTPEIRMFSSHFLPRSKYIVLTQVNE